jgi:PAS domain S-box-containing protein
MAKKYLILVVEDRSEGRGLLRKMLKSTGHDVQEAIDVQEGLEMARLHKPDLIISDTLMPRMDGFRFLRNIKKDKDLKRIPFIFYSSVCTDRLDEELALSLGARAFIEKPIDPDVFIEKLNSLIQEINTKKESESVELNMKEEEYLSRYSDIIANKLEEKMAEFEKVNKDLKLQITKRKKAEEALRDSEDKYRTVFENTGTATCIIENDGTISLTNSKFAQLTGYTIDEIQGKKTWMEFVVKEDLERMMKQHKLRRKDRDKALRSYEFRSIDKKGDIKHIFLTIDVIPGTTKSVASLLDITDHKQTEEELRRMNRFQKTITECNQAMIHADNEENLLNDICRIIVDFGGYRFTWIGYAEKDEQKTVCPVAQAGYEDGYLNKINISWADTEYVQYPTGRVIRTGNPSIVKNILTDQRYTPWRAEAIKRGYASSMALPLISGDQIYGALNIYAAEPEAFDEEEVKLLTELSNDLAYGIVALRTRAEHKQAEEALISSKAQLSNAVNIAHLGPWEYDLVNDLFTFNDHFYAIFRTTVEQVGGYTMSSADFAKRFIHPDDQYVVNLRDIKTTEADEPNFNQQLEHRIIYGDGEVGYATVRVLIEKDEDGKVVRAYGVTQDITEHRQVEEQIRKLSQAVEQSPVSVIITNLKGNIEYVNPKFTQTTGYTFKEIKGQNPCILKTCENPAEEYKKLWETIKKGKIWNGELQNKSKKGRLFWEDVTIGPIRNEKGEITHFIILKEDITKRKQTEEALRNSEQEYFELIQQAPDSILTLNKKGHIESINPATEKMIGYTEQELKGKHFAKSGLLTMKSLPPAIKMFTNLLAGKENPLTEIELIRKDKNHIITEATTRLIKSAGKKEVIQAILRDVTDRKKAEEELRKERMSLAIRVKERTVDLSKANAELAKAAKMKDEFLASMSHELRTPLNAILGLSEALQEEVYGEMNQKQHKSLRSIEESGRHLLSLINDILDIAKIEAGKVSLEINQVSIEMICQASLRLVKQIALKKNLQLIYNNKTSLLTFGADERRLKQILVNLLSNAVKFTQKGGEVGIEVSDDADKEKINFTIWDTGIGITKESMDKLFQPFIQIDSSLTREYSGTGLGLALVKHLTELHGGSITVESEPGEGSRFTVTLPARTTKGVPALDVEEGEEKPGKIETGKEQEVVEEKVLILLAEDNEKNIEMLSDYLLVKGYDMMIARNGKEAVKIAKERTPELILMDIQMPGMDGLEAIKIIRNDEDMKLAKVPIIALTALAMPGDKEKCLAAGADDYMKKPVGLKSLTKKMEEILKS